MNISILGSTGSIGTQTLDCVRDHPDCFKVSAITGNKNVKLLEEQAREFMPELVCVADETAAGELKIKLKDTGIRVLGGKDSIVEAAMHPLAETTVVSVVGMAGIEPTIAAIKSNKRVALANKETLVAAGNIIKDCENEYGKCIIPVDSEHSAIFQSMQGMAGKREIKKILLTASGGTFYGKKRSDLIDIKPSDALHNPNWDMGAKVTIDSSTLVNKGLEMIEAKWLFDVPMDKIEVLVHRQSVLHSAVQFTDNAVIAQLGSPDMRVPIQYALTYPNRMSIPGNELDLFEYASLTFEKPDIETFYALNLARKAGEEAGTLATVFNAADEAAVELFMKEKISYLEITEAIEYAMSEHKNVDNPTLADIYSADKEARECVYSKFSK
ncbi:MAG: 1-deoxy-D-xylulose-5-phosphate reductoisomerase [Clostridia bacterium]|nr:1-deoxy-D-xylulose-5-phosphate reductoisomerase [Clostridia bacterium]